jgi:hypothetical protein
VSNSHRVGLAQADPVTRAIARADAKDRIRTATTIRQTGAGVTIAAVGVLARASIGNSWLPSIHGFDNGFWHGVVTMSLTILAGIVGLAIGPLVFGAGHLLLRRARDAAARDPVTAIVIDQPL